MANRFSSTNERMKDSNVKGNPAEEYFYDKFYKGNYEEHGFCYKYGADVIKMKDREYPNNNFYKLPDFIKYTPDYMVYDKNGKYYLVEVKGFHDIFYLKHKQYLAYQEWNDKHCKVKFFLKDFSSRFEKPFNGID